MVAESARVLVIVPAWNEEASVAAVVRDLVATGYDVLVVDDGSTDKTRSVALASGARVASLPFNLGVGARLRLRIGGKISESVQDLQRLNCARC